MEIFADPLWQMSLGERAAVEGVLSQLKPAVAIEVGTAQGACLARIAAHSHHVHSFDLEPPSVPVADNVTIHVGDSHQLLASVLAEVAERGETVEFALLDGDHSAEGVSRDVGDLLDSRAVDRTVLLIHDSANEEVRLGLDSIRFTDWPRVTHVELDWVPGQLFKQPEARNQLWGGLALIMVGTPPPARLVDNVYQQSYHDAAHLLAIARDEIKARERAADLSAPGQRPAANP